jgi:hypothetical protein
MNLSKMLEKFKEKIRRKTEVLRLKILNYFGAIYWFLMLVDLFLGYEPSKAIIGIAFLQTALSFLITEGK